MLKKFFKRKTVETTKANFEIEEAIQNLRNVLVKYDMGFGALFAGHKNGMLGIFMPEDMTNDRRKQMLRDMINTAKDTLNQYEGLQ